MKSWFNNNIAWRFGKRPMVYLYGDFKGYQVQAINCGIVHKGTREVKR